jgi:predicted Rossmann-fold nucleotide-binding protein
MKGPMQGAAIGHAKQFVQGRYLGITEPGIIASESPNPIVNELVILPDIEQRLEAFVRLAHSNIVFPGGAGTTEEILYVLSLLMNPRNRGPFPLIFTGPAESADYFTSIDRFLRTALGDKVAKHYTVIVGDPQAVAQEVSEGGERTKRYRRKTDESYAYNWNLRIDLELQQPFEPTHERMSSLDLSTDQPPQSLAIELRKALSGIVAGNVKPEGIRAIREHGPFRIRREPVLAHALDELLESFVRQSRLKLQSENYLPCYSIETT